MSDNTKVESIHPSDVELIQQLARVQRMHQQAQQLRDLLPERLIGPMRQAIENPRYTGPPMLASRLAETVKAGLDEISSFKKDWHDEKMREVFAAANVSDVSQGGDYWTVDYVDLIKDQQQQGTVQADYGSRFDNLQETALAFHNFSERKYTHSQLELQDSSKEVPLVFKTRKLAIVIDRDEKNGHYELSLAPDNQKSKVTDMVFETISKTGPWKTLENLLDMLISYHDVRLRPCKKCHKLLNEDLDVPTVRVLERTDGASSWEAYHHNHLP